HSRSSNSSDSSEARYSGLTCSREGLSFAGRKAPLIGRGGSDVWRKNLRRWQALPADRPKPPSPRRDADVIARIPAHWRSAAWSPGRSTMPGTQRTLAGRGRRYEHSWPCRFPDFKAHHIWAVEELQRKDLRRKWDPEVESSLLQRESG